MRPEAAAAIVRARVTHQIPPALTNRGGDALAVVEDQDAADGSLPTGARIFVPGRLPCGDCAACRRALCAACVAARVVRPEPGTRRIAVPERFIVRIDEGAAHPIAAGLVAEIIGAAGRAGLGAGDTAIWIGRQPWTRVGASWSVCRGCRTFLLAPPDRVTPSMSTSAGPIALDPAAGPSVWGAQIADAEAAGGPTGGRPERRIFIFGATVDLSLSALALATPGSTLSFPHGAPPTLAGLDTAPTLRILTGAADHPDLLPDALAALKRGEVDVEGALIEVASSDAAAASAAFLSGPDQPIPIVVFE